MTNKDYYLGLDMGTNSVGWAVTDKNYNLLRVKGKDMWGVRLFDKANTAEERRIYRINRRRREREVARIGVLKEYFKDEIKNVDENFFERLEESKYFRKDRSEFNCQHNALFNDKGFTDKDYFKTYPTIYHLRKELIESKEPHDVRLLYLALHNMFKRRGHFLNQTLNLDGEVGDVGSVLSSLAKAANENGINFPISFDVETIREIMTDQGKSRKKKLEGLSKLMGISKTDKAPYEILMLICGLVGNPTNIFGEEIYGKDMEVKKFSFRDQDFDEKETEMKTVIGDEAYEVIAKAKDVHDAALLDSILQGETYLSFARVKSYEQHKEDLHLLKELYKKYLPGKYSEMFKELDDKTPSYSSYVGSTRTSHETKRRGGVRSAEELYKKIKKDLEPFSQDDEMAKFVIEEIDAQNFLPKQLTSENGVIPNQLHAREMKKILENASSYFPFLNEKDEYGLTLSDRILRLYTFTIPYYVGPLGQGYLDKEGYNVWSKKKETGKIYPWNLEEKFDTKQSAQKFIERMTQHCTYLTGEKSLPKESLLYEKFMVLNELNNVKINDKKPPVELKQKIYHDLFEKGKKVTCKQLKTYLVDEGAFSSVKDVEVSGINGDFKASLKSYGKFKDIFGDSISNKDVQNKIEQIIFWVTVYGDKKLVYARIKEEMPDFLTEEQLKKVSGYKFNGWGNLSRKFLELKGSCKNCSEDDASMLHMSLIDALYHTNDNLMELMTQNRYTYRDELNNLVLSFEKPLREYTIDDLDDMYLSPSVKRMVWQTVKIVREVQEVTGRDPKRIFVEMPREEGEKKESVSRKQKLLGLYKSLGAEGKDWVKEIESMDEKDFRIQKVYLYYLQMGRCMYSGEVIPKDKLFDDNLYDKDHIYPRHYVKDDSLMNNLVLVNKKINAKKSDEYPLKPEIQSAQKDFWKKLKSYGFISSVKFDRLIRTTEFADTEKADFIARQLTETRQGTKAITGILQSSLPKTKVVFTKAGIVSDFRSPSKFDIPKSRSLNAFHHAHDAYLNIVVGNAYYVKFTNNPLNFINMAKKTHEGYKYHLDKVFERDIVRGEDVAWIAEGNNATIKTVLKTLSRGTPLITRRAYEVHGGISNKVTIKSAKEAKKVGYYPIKTSDKRLLNVKRYGGITSIQNAGYALVEYKANGNTIRSLEAVPIYLGGGGVKDDVLLKYMMDTLTLENKKKKVTDVKVIKKLIRQRELVRIDGYEYYIAGKSGNTIALISAVPLKLDTKWTGYIKVIEQSVKDKSVLDKKHDGKQIISKEENLELYQALTNKLRSKPFVNRKCSILSVLLEGEDKFKDLSIEEQGFVLAKIISWFNTQEQTVDLRLIGGTEHSGKLGINKKIADTGKKTPLFNEFTLISQSMTGLMSSHLRLC